VIASVIEVSEIDVKDVEAIVALVELPDLIAMDVTPLRLVPSSCTVALEVTVPDSTIELTVGTAGFTTIVFEVARVVEPFEAATTNVNEPYAVGVPLNNPEELRFNPVGKLPEEILNVGCG
jgi:hypothetical protein